MAVKNFVENDLDILKFDSHIIEDIKDSYIADMKKYVSSELEATKIEKVYKNIPGQLAKDKKNFKYSFIDPSDENERKRKYESAIDWLVASKLILINYKSKRMEIPLRVYIDEFKPKYAIRFSTRNFGFEKNIKSIPLYAAFCIK